MPLTIVAEAGSNWWRPKAKDARAAALEHVREAARCGATAVKFQFFWADSLYSRERAPEQWETAHRLELPEDWVNDLATEAHVAGLEFWLSVFQPPPWSMTHIIDVVKIASGDLTHTRLLESTRPFERVALSTGAATADEVRVALDVLGRKPIMMYCVSKYPARAEDYHLDRFPWSDRALALGVSDHTREAHLVAPAIQIGYTVFEKHFMLPDTPEHLPDHGTSLTPGRFAHYCRVARQAFDLRYRSDFGERGDESERFWARRGPDGLRPAGEVENGLD